MAGADAGAGARARAAVRVLETGAEEGEDEAAPGFELGAGTGDGIDSVGRVGRRGVEGADCVELECIDCCCAIGSTGLPNCVLIPTCRPLFTCGDGPGPAMSADVGGASSAGVRFMNASDD